jgi:hypothetical protein
MEVLTVAKHPPRRWRNKKMELRIELGHGKLISEASSITVCALYLIILIIVNVFVSG